MRTKTIFTAAVVLLFLLVLLTPAYVTGANAAGVHVDVPDSPAQNQRILPVIMYHQLLKTRKGDYIVSPELFERDLIELKKRGYDTVLPRDVIAFGEGRGNLPRKPIMITFDDGHYNNVFYGKSLLEKYGCKAALNVIGKYTDNTVASGDHSQPAYSHLTWEQMREAESSGVFEIGNHTYDMHDSPRKGLSKLRGESEDDYKRAVTADILKLNALLAENSGITAECFAYPFGKYDSRSEDIIVAAGFKMILCCYEMRNMITCGEPHELHRICRFNRTPYSSPAAFFNKMEKARVKEYVTRK